MRERANAYIADQLGTDAPKRAKSSKKSGSRAVDGAEAKGDATKVETAARQENAREEDAPVCPSCSTENDVDAAFCKKCGSKLGDESKRARDAAG
jgi:ribosomal protein L40E